MKPSKTVLDCSTNSTTVVELTNEEIAQMEITALQVASEKAAKIEEQAIKEANKESAKSKLLALGLTEEEITSLISPMPSVPLL